MQLHKQAGNITTNIKVKIFSTSPDFSATKIMAWDFLVDELSKSIYDVILGRYLFNNIRIIHKII